MSGEKIKKILIFGYGNVLRGDDGLGQMLSEKIEALRLEGVTCESDIQLEIEDSAIAAEHGIIVFADSSVDCKEPYEFTKLSPKKSVSITSHSVAPEGILHLAGLCFNSSVQGYLLAIRGYEFNFFVDRISKQAEQNLNEAFEFLKGFISDNCEIHI